MKLIVCAAPRRPPNWHTTLATAWKADPRSMEWETIVCLDAGENEQTTLEIEAYAHLGVEVQILKASEHLYQVNRTAEQRSRFNMVRCLRAADHGPCVIVEDDLTFSRNWTDAIGDICGRSNAVYMGYCRERTPFSGIVVDAVEWDATLMVAWSAGITYAAADYLEKLDGPADNGLSRFWRENGIRRLTLIPSIVQHLGDDALINPGHGKRRSPTWVP